MRALPVLVAALVLSTLPPGARAQTPEILQRLMAEPLSLFDWGLAQLERDVERAGLRLFGPAEGSQRHESGTIYDWRSGRITLFVALQRPERQRTPEACRALFGRIVDELTAAAPAGAGPGWYLRNAFQPKGHVWTSRFEDTGGKLLEVVRLEASLVPSPYAAAAGDSLRVTCSGRLDAAPEALAVEVAGLAER